MSATHWAVVPAAGSGQRMGGVLPKQYLKIAGRSVLEHALVPLLGCPRIATVVLVVAVDDGRWREVLPSELLARVRVVTGGAERCHSVLNGLGALADQAAPDDWVLVHDAARPCLRSDDVERLLDRMSEDTVGGLVAVPACDTMKRAGSDGRVSQTVERAGLWHAQTPQMFRYEALREALRQAVKAGVQVTDEAAAIERAGGRPLLVRGHGDNIKITSPEDLALAEFFLAQQRQG